MSSRWGFLCFFWGRGGEQRNAKDEKEKKGLQGGRPGFIGRGKKEPTNGGEHASKTEGWGSGKPSKKPKRKKEKKKTEKVGCWFCNAQTLFWEAPLNIEKVG